ncbi:hypothetical protein [Candidatus Villigracilis saccharophilus]|uniref:hypothetical protein n=1 Tax=Candidatus Villigracilis saccharophilus TaxID=3140684 RepID=UPI0031364DEE|nr:hypothetical protein [Anaerolineales bacterium]
MAQAVFVVDQKGFVAALALVMTPARVVYIFKFTQMGNGYIASKTYNKKYKEFLFCDHARDVAND